MGKDRSNRGVSQNQPVVHVSCERAVAFCRWLSNRTSKKFNLPTETKLAWNPKTQQIIGDPEANAWQEREQRSPYQIRA